VLHWLAPVAAAAVIVGGGATAGTIVARADSAPPDRSAAQLLVDLQNAGVDGLSGLVVESADLGLPLLTGLVRTAGTRHMFGASRLVTLLSGSTTVRVWQAGEHRQRLSLLSGQDQTDLIRDGSDVWMWNSADRLASHLTLPAGAGTGTGTPQEAADAALAAIDPATTVTTTGAATVAGRDAYELVLHPEDPASLIGQVRIALDAEHHIPLRVEVYARNATAPAVGVEFQQISFAVPDPEQFAFNPPPGTTTTEGDIAAVTGQRTTAPKLIGDGWTSVLTTRLAAGAAKSAIGGLPEVSGPWGTGHLIDGALLTVLITDDARVYAGPVTRERLFEVAAHRR